MARTVVVLLVLSALSVALVAGERTARHAVQARHAAHSRALPTSPASPGPDTTGRTSHAAQAAAGPGTPAFPSAAAVARAVAYLRSRDSDAAIAVVNSRGVVRGYGIDVQFTSASVVKAMLLVAYLRAHATITPDMSRTLRLMITESDNAAAFKVFAAVGPAGLTHLASLTHMKHFTVGETDVLYSRITASDQARYFYAMDSYIPAAQRSFARSLLSSVVPSQSWGIPQVARPAWHVFFKGGWFGAVQDPFTLVNQVARLERGGVTWSLAVLTDMNPHSPYAFVTLRGVTARLLAD